MTGDGQSWNEEQARQAKQCSLLDHQGQFLTEPESHKLFDQMVREGDALEACRLVLAATRQYGPQWIEPHLEPPVNTAQEVLPFAAA